MAAFLEVEGLRKEFGGVQVLDGLSLGLGERETLCLIGPNGCGKSTLFNLLTGELRPSGGSVRFRGEDLARLEPFEIARRGIGRKFQVPSVYPDLSVRDNVEVALFARPGVRGLAGLLHTRRSTRARRAAEVLETVGLAQHAERRAGTLSHGQKQWLEIAIVLAGQPRLMLLDEPTAGMTREETVHTARLVAALRERRDVAVILIEHDMHFVETLDCPVAVMLRGSVIATGSFAQVRALEAVRTAYLGEALG